MGNQQNAIQGSYALQLPGTTKKGSGGGTLPKKLEITELTKGISSITELKEEADVMSFRSDEYFAKKGVAEKARSIYNIGFQKKFASDYNRNLGAFWEGEAGNMAAGMTTVIDLNNQALAYRNKAEQEKKEFLESDLNKMEQGSVLYDNVGNEMLVSDVLNGGTLLDALNQNQRRTLSFLGIDPTTDLSNMTEQDKLKFVSANKQDWIMRREDRIALQSVLPMGFGFSDVNSLDPQHYYDSMEDMAKMHGTTTIGVDDDKYVMKMNEEQIDGLLKMFHFDMAPSDPKISRDRNVMLRRISNEKSARLISAGSVNHNKWTSAYHEISEVKDLIGVKEFDEFLGDTSSIIEQINNASISEQEKEDYIKTIQNRDLVVNTLMFQDLNDDILREETVSNLMIDDLMVREKDVLMSRYKVPRGNQKYDNAADRAIVKAQQGDYGGFEKRNPYEKMIKGSSAEISQAVLNGNAANEVLFNDNALENAASYVAMKGKGVNGKEFFSGGNSDDRVSNYLLYKTKGRIFDKFVAHAKKNKNVIDGFSVDNGDMVGSIVNGTDVYGGNDFAAGGTRLDKNVKYKGGVLGKADYGIFGIGTDSALTWKQLMKKEGFQDWAKSSLSPADYKKLYSVKDYMAGSIVNSENPQASAIMAKASGGGVTVDRWDIKSTNKYSPYIGQFYQKNDIEYWDPAQGKNIRSSSSFLVVGEEAVLTGLTSEPNTVHVESSVIMTKEDMKAYTWKDLEGVEHNYWDDYGKPEFSVYAANEKGNPEATRYLDSVGGLGIKAMLVEDKEALKDKYIVPLFIKRKNSTMTGQWAGNKKISGAKLADSKRRTGDYGFNFN